MRKRKFGRRLSAIALSLMLVAGNFSGTATSSFVYADEELGSGDDGGSGDTSDSGDSGSDSSVDKSGDDVCRDSGDSASGEDGNSGSSGGTSDAGSSKDGGAGDDASSDGADGEDGSSKVDGGTSDSTDAGEGGNTDSSDSDNAGSGSDKSDKGSDSGEEGMDANTAESKSEESGKNETSAESRADETKTDETNGNSTIDKESTAETNTAESEAKESSEADTNGNGGIIDASEAETKESEAETETETEESTEAETLPEETVETIEEKKEAEILFHVVDEDGNDVDDKYNDAKVSFDKEGILNLDDSEKPPVKKVRRQTGSHLFGLIKTYTKNYTYKEATLNGDVIKAVKKTKTEDKETVYEYTLDGETWTKFDNGTEILLVYIAPDSQGVGHAEYIEEGRIKVTVDMNKELPEGVELRVSELKSGDDNYSAYMTALDDAAKESGEETEVKEHTEENTMLYDIAFIGTDDDGNEYEYQPGDDVSVKVSFLGGQLAGELGATDASNVEVKHLPIKDEVKESAAIEGQLTTADIIGLSASDISVEEVKQPKVTLDKSSSTSVQAASLDDDEEDTYEDETDSAESKDEVAFGVSSFCVFSFTSGEQNAGTYWNGTETISVKSFKDTLGLAGHVAVYADEFYLNTCDHVEGSIAVNNYEVPNVKFLDANNVESHNNVVEIELTKIVNTIENSARNFEIGFFKSNDPTSKDEAVKTVKLTVPANESSVSQTLKDSNCDEVFNALKNQSLYVYEIDEKGNIAKTEYCDSSGNKKFDVKYYNSDDSTLKNEILGGKNIFGNYIKTIKYTGLSQYVDNKFFGGKGFHTYLGSDYPDDHLSDTNGHLQIFKADGSVSIILQDYRNMLTQKADETYNTQEYIHKLSQEEFESKTKLDENLGENGEFAKKSVELANAKNGASEDGKKNFNVINVISDPRYSENNKGKLQYDLESYAGFKSTANSKNESQPDKNVGIRDLLKACEKDDEYLLINIDATGKNTYTLTKLMIDGDIDNDDNYPRTGSHVVYNFVQKNNEGKFEPYTGTINVDDVVYGTVFAPCATFYMSGGLRGSVIANYVEVTGSEIHQKSFGSSERRYVDITIANSDPGNTPTPTSASFSVNKTLDGKELEENQFSFELKDFNGNVLQIKKNAKDGTVKFDAITYSAAGTYEYTISEVQGNKPGYTYDENIVTVTVTVKQNADGTLTASVSYSGNTTFANTYTEPDRTSVKFVVKKILENKDLEANQFYFVLKDASNEEKQKVQNNANGEVEFVSIWYGISDMGTHEYTISEVAGADTQHYSYDSHVINVTVSVSRDSTTGKLVATVNYGNEEPKFINTYKPDETPSTESSTEATKSTESSTEATKPTESSTEATKSTESTTESTKATETTSGGNKGGGGGGGGRSDSKKSTTPGTVEGVSRDKDPSETTESGQVLGVERDRTVPESESEGQVKGVSRNARTGDNSMMRLFGVGFVGAAVLLLAWLWVRFRRKEHR